MDQSPQFIEFAGFKCQVGKRGSDLPTAKQGMVLAGLAAGMTQKEIARVRGISPATVRSTAEGIYCRLQANRATDAIIKGLRRGWIAPLALALMLADLHGHALRTRQPIRTRQQSSSTYRSTRRDLGSVLA